MGLSLTAALRSSGPEGSCVPVSLMCDTQEGLKNLGDPGTCWIWKPVQQTLMHLPSRLNTVFIYVMGNSVNTHKDTQGRRLFPSLSKWTCPAPLCPVISSCAYLWAQNYAGSQVEMFHNYSEDIEWHLMIKPRRCQAPGLQENPAHLKGSSERCDGQ